MDARANEKQGSFFCWPKTGLNIRPEKKFLALIINESIFEALKRRFWKKKKKEKTQGIRCLEIPIFSAKNKCTNC